MAVRNRIFNAGNLRGTRTGDRWNDFKKPEGNSGLPQGKILVNLRALQSCGIF
jgi:hypothetical protein